MKKQKHKVELTPEASHRHTLQDASGLQGAHRGLKHLPYLSRMPPKPLRGYTTAACARDTVRFF